MTETIHSAIAHRKCLIEAMQQGIPFSYTPWRRTFNFYPAMNGDGISENRTIVSEGILS